MKAFAGTSISHFSTVALSKADFLRVKRIIHDYSGIYVNDRKKVLVQSRLMKRLRKLKMQSFTEYLNFIESDAGANEFLAFVDVLTTNKTDFFREAQHFTFIEQRVLPELAGQDIKWWSAGCSSGEEPITTAITLLENRRKNEWSSAKILATDLSNEVLHTAARGIYSSDRFTDVPMAYRRKYFREVGQDEYQVVPEIQNMIMYKRLNLLSRWPLRGNFQVIMCRNVMIYFNRETQKQIVNKFRRMLAPGGYLFLGHSESISPENKGFKNQAPAVYKKVEG